MTGPTMWDDVGTMLDAWFAANLGDRDAMLAAERLAARLTGYENARPAANYAVEGTCENPDCGHRSSRHPYFEGVNPCVDCACAQWEGHPKWHADYYDIDNPNGREEVIEDILNVIYRKSVPTERLMLIEQICREALS